MNKMAALAQFLGADIEHVRLGIGSDPRIGYDFIYSIYPGCGYGGSCFPKDVQALQRTAEVAGHPSVLLQAVEAVYDHQKTVLFDRLPAHFGSMDALRGRRIAVWGLAFKPNTDDMREAPSRVVIDSLLAAGATVKASDPEAMREAAKLYASRADIKFCASKKAAAQDADALAICTKWKSFLAPDFAKLAQAMIAKLILAGRNLYGPSALARDGWQYYAIGRGLVVKAAA